MEVASEKRTTITVQNAQQLPSLLTRRGLLASRLVTNAAVWAGSTMRRGSLEPKDYPYGLNGKEMDSEVKAAMNTRKTKKLATTLENRCNANNQKIHLLKVYAKPNNKECIPRNTKKRIPCLDANPIPRVQDGRQSI